MSTRTPTKTYRLAVTGMHCVSCERAVSEQLRGLPGVIGVSANAADGSVEIVTAEPLDPTAVASAAAAAGFTSGELAEQPSIAQVAAEASSTSATAGADDPAVAPETARAAVVGEVSETFAIGGMHCASCSAVIEKSLGKMPGVVEANVNLATEQLVARWDPSLIDAGEIIAASRRWATPLRPCPSPSGSAAKAARSPSRSPA